MIGLRIAPLVGAAAKPWRNGGGVTRELLAWQGDDDGSGEWTLRVSVARVDSNGPFSAFPDVERWFAVVHGDGVALELDGRTHTLAPHSEPLCFDGAATPGCKLLGGATVDLNLMLRRAAGHGAMQRAQAETRWRSPAAWRAMYASGPARLQIDGSPVADLAADALVWHPHAAGQDWGFHPREADTRAWFLSFQPHERAS